MRKCERRAHHVRKYTIESHCRSLPSWIATLSALVIVCLLACCSSVTDAEQNGANGTGDHATQSAINIVATTGMIGDVVREVGGEHVNVTVLMGPGVDPHLYRPTRDDVVRMVQADLVFANGLDLEGKMMQTFRQLDRVIFVAERVDPAVLLSDEDFEGAYDPHLWMDPGLWIAVVEIIRDALIEYTADDRSEWHPAFASRAEDYIARLRDLDEYARARFSTIPEHRLILVTAHDAFAYLGRAYGVEVLGIQGISTDSEAGLRRIEELVDRLVRDEIPVVFTETSVADKHVRALIVGARAKGHDVRIGGELFSDAMAPAGTYEGTYIGMIDHNVTTIVRALGGDAPPRGLHGRLAGRD